MDNLEKANQTITRFKYVAIISFMVALLCIVAYWITDSVSKQIIQSNISSMEELALHDERSIKNSLEIRWAELSKVSDQLRKKGFSDTSDIANELRESIINVTSADYLMLVTNDGVEYRSTGLISKSPELANVVAGRDKKFVTRYNEDQSTMKEHQKEMLVMGVPVSIDGPGGVHFDWLLCRLAITTLETELKIDSYEGRGFSSVIDNDGNYIIYISRSHNLGTFDNFFKSLDGATFEGYSSIEELKKVITEGEHSVIYKTADGQENIMVVAAMNFVDWCFITTVPISVFNAQTQSIMTSFLILLGVAIIVFAITFFLSIRQRRQSEKLRIAEAKNIAKTSFLFNMSHDIRTPMNIILGFTDIAANHINDKDRVTDCLKKIKCSGSLLLGLINDILEMSRVEEGTIDIVVEPVNITQISDVINPMIESLAQAKDITYKYSCKSMDDPHVYMDVQHFSRVLVNLLTNAVKYTKPGGEVDYQIEQLECDENGKGLYQFTISDTGVGMSQDYIKNNLYQQFSREKTSTLSKQQGTGLGLAIVKKVVDAMGGKIEVDSVVDEGTTFTVTVELDIQSADDISTNTKVVVDENVDYTLDLLKDKKALLVEDNELNTEIAVELMEEAGIIVEHAADGLQALERVKERGVDYFDFIIMDIQMPVMDGYESTREIRKLPGGEDIVIVAVSANAFIDDKRKSEAAGMNDHIAKPVDINELVKSISNFLN